MAEETPKPSCCFPASPATCRPLVTSGLCILEHLPPGLHTEHFCSLPLFFLVCPGSLDDGRRNPADSSVLCPAELKPLHPVVRFVVCLSAYIFDLSIDTPNPAPRRWQGARGTSCSGGSALPARPWLRPRPSQLVRSATVLVRLVVGTGRHAGREGTLRV